MADKMPLLFQKDKALKRNRSSDHKLRGHCVNLTVDSMERLKRQSFLESTILKGDITMTKINVWELVKKEADAIINGVENGEFHTMKEINDYLTNIYSWNFSACVMNIVNAYISLNNIEMPWDNE